MTSFKIWKDMAEARFNEKTGLTLDSVKDYDWKSAYDAGDGPLQALLDFVSSDSLAHALFYNKVEAVNVSKTPTGSIICFKKLET